MKKLLLLLAACINITAYAQTNFTYTPENPKAGDEISFTYTPSGDLAGLLQIPEAFVMVFTNQGPEIKDIKLQREYGKLIGKIKTDTAAQTVAFGFTHDEKFDNNQNNGYIIQLLGADGKIKPLSYSNAANIYSDYGEWKLGMAKNNAKAIKNYQQMFAQYPDTKNDHLINYLYTAYSDNKETGAAEIQKEIEALLKGGLKDEKSYDLLSSMYNILRLKQQSSFISKLKNEKFPQAGKKLGINEYYEKYIAEGDLNKKKNILEEVIQASKTAKDADNYKSFINYLQRNVAGIYADKKDWDGFKKFASQITDETAKATLYNSTAWNMQKDSTNLKLAEELSAYALNYGKADLKNPKGEKPKMQRYSEWLKQKQTAYGTYADTYAMILYRMGQYKKALPYTTEATYTINKGLNADNNNTYALVAERASTPKKYKAQLEQFVKDGKSGDGVLAVLKRLYIKEKSNEAGFDSYIATLEKEAYNKMLADLKKEMINEASPKFTLKDLAGNTINMADLKGKTVVVDFWATWCGPCIASMPGMKKMVNKYKDDPNVKFVFIDTWQNEENETEVVKKFITEKGYDEFHVLMDLDDKVVSSFKVDGIPTKFIVGKDGNIKFKEVGFDGEDNLVKKLPAMIELAN